MFKKSCGYDSNYKLFAFTTTWTRYTYTIPATGTATSVGIVDSNAFGFRIEYHLFAGPDDVHSQFTQWTSNSSPTYKVISGQKNFMDNTNNELYITGLQIEVGDTETSFEHRTYSDELLRCQRYFTFAPSGTVFPGRGNSGSSYIYSYQSTVPMRVSPTIGVSNDIAHGTFGVRRYRDGTGVSDSTSTPTTSSTYFSPNSNMIHLIQGGFSGADDRSATLFVSGGAITISAEL